MTKSKNVERVAIVGASGHVGVHFAEELLKTGKHTVTAITHARSKGKLPKGVTIAKVDYEDDGESLVQALQGQDFLIITLGVRAPGHLHSKIVAAAAKAGVPHIMPNVYGFDYLNEGLAKEDRMKATVELISDVEKSGIPYVAMVCGFWYEWSLGSGEQWYGFDIPNKKVTFYDDGNTPINTSTWGHCGRALAALLSLPEKGSSPALSDWENKPFYVSSFKTTQRDMLDSLNRVLGTSDKDWEISYEPSTQRYKDGLAEVEKGIFLGYPKSIYARSFYPNGGGEFQSNRELSNDVLKLPKEDLDEATKRTVEMVESGWKPF